MVHHLTSIFSHIKPFKALVLGDFMLDCYTYGKVRRISPEAPVPVMEVVSQDSRPGGAGNVVLNLLKLGGYVYAAGRVGDDLAGHELKKLLHGCDFSAFITQDNYKTCVKNRLIADAQQLLRIDVENVVYLPTHLEDQVLQNIEKIIHNVDVLAISDYAKGFLTNRLIFETIKIAKAANVKVIVDPKGIDFSKYKDASIIKPNLSEAYAAAKLISTTDLNTVASELLKMTQVEHLLITRSEQGISLFDQKQTRQDFPVRSKEVKDVTGAGDTVLSMICLAVANKLDMDAAVELANIAAGIGIEKIGCAQIGLSEIAERLREYGAISKVFDDKDCFLLDQLLCDKNFSLLVLDSNQMMTNALFKAIRSLASNKEQLIIYIQDALFQNELIDILSSLQEVDFIILQKDSLRSFLQQIPSQKIFFLENEHLVEKKDPKKILKELLYQSV